VKYRHVAYGAGFILRRGQVDQFILDGCERGEEKMKVVEEIVGVRFNWKKFDELRKFWIKKERVIWYCPLHNTYFNLVGHEDVE